MSEGHAARPPEQSSGERERTTPAAGPSIATLRRATPRPGSPQSATEPPEQRNRPTIDYRDRARSDTPTVACAAGHGIASGKSDGGADTNILCPPSMDLGLWSRLRNSGLIDTEPAPGGPQGTVGSSMSAAWKHDIRTVPRLPVSPNLPGTISLPSEHVTFPTGTQPRRRCHGLIRHVPKTLRFACGTSAVRR